MTTDEPAVTVRGLTKRYGNYQAVAGIDLDIRHGEIFALLGPNGAGKTTAVEILEGYRDRDAGEVQVLGIDPGKAGPHWRARIGIVLQSTKDLADLTPTEALAASAAYYPNPRPVTEVLDLVGLTDKRSTRGDQLSGGQRRRLDVGMGILGRPELLFLDEPTTGFDPEARRHFWTLIESLSELGTTILLTTHYLDEAERLADRVGVIARGELLAVDTPQALGGRGTAQATVTWHGPNGPEEEHTDTPTQFVARLGTSFDGEIPELQILRPTLEDAYLAMIGESR
ncbi:MAG: ABC transporter ATP-binding protein [Geodermatophilaceae bacterium]|nr:ABC transporter ATP-binding protein [Geodermatophilaceae bacterium]